MEIVSNPQYLILKGLGEHSQGYNEESFKVFQGDSKVPFIIEILGEDSVKLHFDNKLKDGNYVLFIKLFSIDGTLVIDTNECIKIEETPKDEDSNGESTPTMPTIEFLSNGLELEFNEEILKKDIKITIEKYILEQFEDFSETKERITFEVDEDGHINKEIEYPWAKDSIYLVEVTYKKEKSKEYHIEGKPSLYFTSIYHILQMSKELGVMIEENNTTTFDLKLMIWRFSKVAYGMIGLRSDVEDTKIAILGDYINNRVLLNYVTMVVRDINMDKDKAGDALMKYSVSLGDYENNNTQIETLVNQLMKVHKDLANRVTDMEEKLPGYFSHLQATVSIEKESDKKIVARAGWRGDLPYGE